jgi:hypothetical protein
VVGWATGASSDPSPLLPITCLSPCSGWLLGSSYFCGSLAAVVWRLHEVGAKAWTMTSADAMPSLEASFSTSPPTVLDFVGENLPSAGWLVDALGVVSFLKA